MRMGACVRAWGCFYDNVYYRHTELWSCIILVECSAHSSTLVSFWPLSIFRRVKHHHTPCTLRVPNWKAYLSSIIMGYMLCSKPKRCARKIIHISCSHSQRRPTRYNDHSINRFTAKSTCCIDTATGNGVLRTDAILCIYVLCAGQRQIQWMQGQCRQIFINKQCQFGLSIRSARKIVFPLLRISSSQTP